MTIEQRRERDRAARRQLIVSTARRIAEAEGWDAVTTRRLSAEIEYSQPVLYKHFSSMEAVAQGVAVDGFRELAESVFKAGAAKAGAAKAGAAKAGGGATEPGDVLRRIAHAYIDFALANPAVYDAMFTRATTLHFAAADTPPELSAAFAGLRDAVAAVAGTADVDTDTATETLWAALHGMATLGRSGRLRAGHDSDRVNILTALFVAGLAPRSP